MTDTLSLLRKRAAREKRATERPGIGRSTSGPTQSLRKADRPSTDVSGAPTARGLKEAIEGARYWGELEAALRNVDRAFRDGALTQTEALELAALGGDRGRGLPEKVSDRS